MAVLVNIVPLLKEGRRLVVMSRKYFACTLAVLLGIWLLGGCSGTSVNTANNVGERLSNATADNPFVTELIAGAGGWNNGGWPLHGTDVGQVYVWNDGTNLYVKYETDGAFYFGGGGVDNLHLWVGEDASVLPGVAPGQFPWSYAVPSNGTSYTFTIPLSGNYPAGGYMDGAAYDWSSGETLEIAAHALVCSEGGGGGGGDGSTYCTYEVSGASGDTITIWAGQNINAGTAYMSFFEDGGDTYMEIDINLVDGWLICGEDHLWVGTDHDGYPQVQNGPNAGTPKFGQFPYSHTFDPPYPTTDSFIVNLTQDVDGFAWDENDMASLCFILHVVVCQYNESDGTYSEHQTGIAWVPGTDDFPGNRWGGEYCFDVTRTCGEDGGGGDDGGETCQTAWGFDSDGNMTNDDGSNIGDGTSANEDGWFPNYFGIHRWGWIFEYPVTE